MTKVLWVITRGLDHSFYLSSSDMLEKESHVNKVFEN